MLPTCSTRILASRNRRDPHNTIAFYPRLVKETSYLPIRSLKSRVHWEGAAARFLVLRRAAQHIGEKMERISEISRRAGVAVCVFTLGLLAGCASSLDKSATSVDLSEKSLVVVSAKFKNSYRPAFPARALRLSFKKLASPAETPAQASSQTATVSEQLMSTAEYLAAEGDEALFVLQLKPGRYEIDRILGSARYGILAGAIDFSVKAPFEVAPQAATYLGHIDITNVERKNSSDQASGHPLSLIDQAASGLSGGTLEIRLSDRFESDIHKTRAAYVALQKIEFIRAPLVGMRMAPAAHTSAAPRNAVVVRN